MREGDAKKFKFLDHPSNLEIQAFGKNLPELFTNAGLGLMTYLYPKKIDIAGYETKKEICLRAGDSNQLLTDWLFELMRFANDHDICCNAFEFERINDEELKANVFGRRIRSREKINSIVKDKTRIEKNQDGLQVTVVFKI